MSQETQDTEKSSVPLDVPKGAWELLWNLTKKHPVISTLTASLLLYFVGIGIAHACVNQPIAQWFKTHASPVYVFGKAIYNLFENHHGIHEILLGLGGILIGIFVAVLIEEAKEEKEAQLHQETVRISETTTKLLEIVTPKVEVIEDYEELLEKIGEVIDHAAKIEGDLLIMNLSASFGYFLAFDSDTVLKLKHEPLNKDHHQQRIQSIKVKTGRTYHALYDKLLQEQRLNENKLEACVSKKEADKSGVVEYLTLNPTMPSGTVPFRQKYLDTSLQDGRVETYDSASDDNLKPDEKEIKKLYLVPEYTKVVSKKSDGTKKTDAELLEELKDHLIKKQQERIQELKNHNITVTELSEIPLQVFLSMPKSSQTPGVGVFMFVNQHTLSRTSYLAAFRTKEREVLETFKAIFESVKKSKP